MPIATFDPKAVGDYTELKGQKYLLYVNWRHLLNAHRSTDPAKNLDAMFKKFSEEWHVDAIKFGFVPVGSQVTTKTVYGWVQKAVQYKLAVDIHDEMAPTGPERKYPNLLTMEGIPGDETNAFAGRISADCSPEG